jgi:hypothetical protein
LPWFAPKPVHASAIATRLASVVEERERNEEDASDEELDATLAMLVALRHLHSGTPAIV